MNDTLFSVSGSFWFYYIDPNIWQSSRCICDYQKGKYPNNIVVYWWKSSLNGQLENLRLRQKKCKRESISIPSVSKFRSGILMDCLVLLEIPCLVYQTAPTSLILMIKYNIWLEIFQFRRILWSKMNILLMSYGWCNSLIRKLASTKWFFRLNVYNQNCWLFIWNYMILLKWSNCSESWNWCFRCTSLWKKNFLF